jgi:hypothetical protein
MSTYPRTWPGQPDEGGPHFSAGSRVTVIFPGVHRGKEGLVIEIVEHKGDFVYRYRVGLTTGDTATFFEFELAPA